MSLISDMRALVDVGNAIGADPAIGANCYVVRVRREQYDRPLEDAATLDVGQSPYVTLAPAPPVERLPPERAALFSGGPVVASTGESFADVWRVGPIPREYTDVDGTPRGYSLATLLPESADPSQRVVWVLTGPDTEPTGAVCEVVDVDASDDLQTFVIVKRTARVGAP